MCRSEAEGGQRCHTHALKRFQRASNDYRTAMANLPSEPSEQDRAHVGGLYEALTRSRDEYASTPKGERELQAQAHALEANGREGAARTLRESITRGRDIRNVNRAVQRSAEQNSAFASIGDIADRRAGDEYAHAGIGRGVVQAIERRRLQFRYKTFRDMAERDPSLHAPRGWAARHRTLTRMEGQFKVRSRAGQYALYRALQNAEEDLPSLPEGMFYRRTVTSWRDLRPGDVITEPGTRSPGDVEHEGKVVATTEDVGGISMKVVFTDGTDDTRSHAHFTLMRPTTQESAARARRYEQMLTTNGATRGRDEHGAYAMAHGSDERVYAH